MFLRAVVICLLSSLQCTLCQQVGDEKPRKVVDEDSQENLWEEIKGNYLQIPVTIVDNEVNSIPADANAADYLKVVCISDTHDNFDKVIDRVPPGDVLLFAGDLTQFGDERSILNFNELLGGLNHTYKIFIAGNHEMGWDLTEDLSERRDKYKNSPGVRDGFQLVTNAIYLQDRPIEIEGTKFYGSPWHTLKGYPFYRPRNETAQIWAQVPTDTDVLITHNPPLGYMDLYPPVERWGDYALLQKVGEVKPQFHVFGHNHYERGALRNEYTTFMNVASKNGRPEEGDPWRAPLVFYIRKRNALGYPTAWQQTRSSYQNAQSLVFPVLIPFLYI